MDTVERRHKLDLATETALYSFPPRVVQQFDFVGMGTGKQRRIRVRYPAMAGAAGAAPAALPVNATHVVVDRDLHHGVAHEAAMGDPGAVGLYEDDLNHGYMVRIRRLAQNLAEG